ncbi:MAG: NADH-quinone oxidoreductase subunit NuoE family protein [Candidatus Heimdallarchaeaceae archaeon]
MHNQKNLENILNKYHKDPSALIQILNELQKTEKYLPLQSLELLSKELKISMSKIYGVISFYEQFKLVKPGKHTITSCMGTACFINGANSLAQTVENSLGIKAGETSEDGLFTYEHVACLGCCALAPVVQINDEIHGKNTTAKIHRIIKKLKKQEEGAKP